MREVKQEENDLVELRQLCRIELLEQRLPKRRKDREIRSLEGQSCTYATENNQVDLGTSYLVRKINLLLPVGLLFDFPLGSESSQGSLHTLKQVQTNKSNHAFIHSSA